MAVEEFIDDDLKPKYTILSHRWGLEEVTLQDMQSEKGLPEHKAGFAKIKKLCELTVQEHALAYCWVDTCCIDKTSSAELSEAINSMFRWYAESIVCYAYLTDVDCDDRDSFERSVWFTRGWTLQELIAPPNVIFFDRRWELLGDRKTMGVWIQQISGVPSSASATSVIGSRQSLDQFGVAARMSWAARRTTTRKEDMAYCLMGLFNVNMPLLYGEGQEKAFFRLQEEIIKRTDDRSIFAWSTPHRSRLSSSSAITIGRSLIAPDVSYFESCGEIRPSHDAWGGPNGDLDFTITNRGLSIAFPMHVWTFQTYVALLSCETGHLCAENNCQVGILLHRLAPETHSRYTRVSLGDELIYTCQLKDPVRHEPMVYNRITISLIPHQLPGIRKHDILTMNFTALCRPGNFWWLNSVNRKVLERRQPVRPEDDHTIRIVSVFQSGYREVVSLVCQSKILAISALRFGLDFACNPVIFFFKKENFPHSHQVHEVFVWEDQVIDRYSKSTKNNWLEHGMFALRVHGGEYFMTDVGFLGLTVEIEWNNGWKVGIESISKDASRGHRDRIVLYELQQKFDN